MALADLRLSLGLIRSEQQGGEDHRRQGRKADQATLHTGDPESLWSPPGARTHRSP